MDIVKTEMAEWICCFLIHFIFLSCFSILLFNNGSISYLNSPIFLLNPVYGNNLCKIKCGTNNLQTSRQRYLTVSQNVLCLRAD